MNKLVAHTNEEIHHSLGGFEFNFQPTHIQSIAVYQDDDGWAGCYINGQLWCLAEGIEIFNAVGMLFATNTNLDVILDSEANFPLLESEVKKITPENLKEKQMQAKIDAAEAELKKLKAEIKTLKKK